jgi:hypothetical protein
VRLATGELAVADHAVGEQGEEQAAELDDDGDVDAEEEDGGRAGAAEEEERRPEAAVVEAGGLKAEDEGEQVEGEGEHPQKWDDGDLEGDLGGDGEQEGGGDRGEHEP